MPLEPAIEGAEYAGQNITWKYKKSQDPVDLTGATTLEAYIKNKNDSNPPAKIAGSINPVDLAQGQVAWVYGTADVATRGSYSVQLIATFSNGKKRKTFIEDFDVEPALDV